MYGIIFGKVYLHSLEYLPLHKLSCDHKHEKHMLNSWKRKAKSFHRLRAMTKFEREKLFNEDNKKF